MNVDTKTAFVPIAETPHAALRPLGGCDAPVHTHAKATAGWHAITHGAQIIFIQWMLLFFIVCVIMSHFYKTLLLVERIVQLGEGVA